MSTDRYFERDSYQGGRDNSPDVGHGQTFVSVFPDTGLDPGYGVYGDPVPPFPLRLVKVYGISVYTGTKTTTVTEVRGRLCSVLV